MKFSKDTIIGLVVVGTIIILIWGINFLKGFNMLSSEKIFCAKYERVDGLKNSSPVTLRGFKIGQIKSISFSDAIGSSLIVKFSISDEFQIPSNTEARIISSDIMGSKEIKLILGNSK